MRSSERGSTALELVLLFPVIILLFLFVIAGGRLVAATNAVGVASRDAARAASRSTTGSAEAVARQTAEASLSADGMDCSTDDVEIDTSQFHPGGTVSVTVRCHVPLQDVALLRLPSSKTISAHAVAPIDRFKMVS